MAERLCENRAADVAGLRGRTRRSRAGRVARGLDLGVGRVVTPAARFIGIPADLRAGWCLCLMFLNVMAKSLCKYRTADGTRLRGRAGRCCAGRMARGLNL